MKNKCEHRRFSERFTYDGLVEWFCLDCGLTEKSIQSATALAALLRRARWEQKGWSA